MCQRVPRSDLFPHQVVLAAEAEAVAREHIRYWKNCGITAGMAWEALGRRGYPKTDWARPRAFIIRWWIDQHQDRLTAADHQEGKTMSRIRSLHPSQWTEEDFVQCSMAARLLLLGLRNEADDHGVFEWRPVSLKMRVLPDDPVDVATLLAELVEHHQIARFEADGRIYGVCLLWDQQPRRPHYRYPAPPKDLHQITDVRTDADNVRTDPDTDRTDPDTDRTDPPVTVLESESESKGGGRAQARETHPPKDLPDEWREEAQRQRAELGRPPTDLEYQWTRFKNHHAIRPELITRGDWLNWALTGHAAGNGAANGADLPTEPAAELSEQRQEANWGRSVDWWRKFDPIQQTRVRIWVKQGIWRGITGPPGAPNCAIESELAEAAIAERTRRLGLETTEREAPNALPDNAQAQRREAAHGHDGAGVPEASGADAAASAAGGAGASHPAAAGRKRAGKRARPAPRAQPSLLMPVVGGREGTASDAAEEMPEPEQQRGKRA